MTAADVERWERHLATKTALTGRTWPDPLPHPAEARVFPDRSCSTCGQPCQYPPECRTCAADDEAAAKRASDR